MLENILEQINKNLERIANSLEKESAKVTAKRKNAKDSVNSSEAKEVKTENVQAQITTEEPTQNVVNPIEQTVTPVVPVNTAPVTYTQEEIARAMSSAMDAGRSDIVFNILKVFNTNSLMGINPNQYGEVARMLREAGIKI